MEKRSQGIVDSLWEEYLSKGKLRNLSTAKSGAYTVPERNQGWGRISREGEGEEIMGREAEEGKGRRGREGEKGKGSSQGIRKNIWGMEG